MAGSEKKNEAAVARGSRGGQARAKSLSKKRLSEIARHAGKAGAAARWEKWRLDNPDKLAESEERRDKRAAKKKVSKKTPKTIAAHEKSPNRRPSEPPERISERR
jgi:hypothetical protein